MNTMTQEEIRLKVDEVIIMCLGVDPDDVTPETILGRELGADEVDAVEITMGLERRLGVSTPFAQMNDLDTYSVKEVYELVEKLIDK
jgi:acyl carrier protein